MGIEKTAKDLLAAMTPKEQPTAYDTTATVTRVEDDTLWVHIPGGIDETPVRKTVSATSGDEIQIRVGGGRAWAVGNATAPPTDDRRANEALHGVANEKAERVAAVDQEREERETDISNEQTAREQAIAALSQRMDDAGGLYETTQTTSSGTIYYLHDKPNKSDSDLIIELNASGLRISTNGGSTWAAGFDFATQTAVLNILSAAGVNADWINAGTLNVNRIAPNSVGVGKLTGSITNGNWSIDLEHGTFTIGNISADNITTGALTVKDSNDNTIFDADVSNGSASICGWEVHPNGFTYTEPGTQETWAFTKNGIRFGELYCLLPSSRVILDEIGFVPTSSPNPNITQCLAYIQRVGTAANPTSVNIVITGDVTISGKLDAGAIYPNG